jgi:hypothetical protein
MNPAEADMGDILAGVDSAQVIEKGGTPRSIRLTGSSANFSMFLAIFFDSLTAA